MAISFETYDATALYTAQIHAFIRSGDIDSFRHCLDVHPELVSEQGKALLRTASAEGRDAHVRALLERHVPVNHTDKSGLAAIDHAAKKHQWQVVETLLEAGAYVNGSPRTERSGAPIPLMYAAQAGNVSMMHTLKEAGAMVNYRDSKGQNLVAYAAQANEHGAQAVRLALDMLHSPHLSKRLLATTKDLTGEEPLHAAARARSTGAIEALIEAGANPDVANVLGQKPADLTHDEGCLAALTPPTQGSLLDAPRSR